VIYRKPDPLAAEKKSKRVTVALLGFVFFTIIAAPCWVIYSSSKAAAEKAAKAHAEKIARIEREKPTPEQVAADAAKEAERRVISYVDDYAYDEARKKVAGLDVEWDWFPDTHVVARREDGGLFVDSVHPYKATILGTRVKQAVLVRSLCFAGESPQCRITAVVIRNAR
jgi:hypothetical protein